MWASANSPKDLFCASALDVHKTFSPTGIVQALRSFRDPLKPTAEPKVPQSRAVPEPGKDMIPAVPSDDAGIQGTHLPIANPSLKLSAF